MTELKRFQCLNCGHRFEVEVLTPEEKREAKREDRPVSAGGVSAMPAHRYPRGLGLMTRACNGVRTCVAISFPSPDLYGEESELEM